MAGTGFKGQVSMFIKASPQDLWDALSDVTRMGEWSPECYKCIWVGRATSPEVGAKFRGFNRRGWKWWFTTARVTASQRGMVFAFETMPFYPLSGKVQSRWRFDFQPQEDGTLVTESFEVLWTIGVVAKVLFGGNDKRPLQLQEGARQTLERIKTLFE